LGNNYIDAEIERRKSKVGGYQKFKAFASRARSKTANVAGRAARGAVGAVKTLDKASSDMKARRLKSTNESLSLERARYQLAKTKARREKLRGSSGGPLSGLGGDSPFSLKKE